jgi:hypothetical protein
MSLAFNKELRRYANRVSSATDLDFLAMMYG